MKLKTTLIAIAGLSLAAVVFAQTSQSSSSQSSRGSSAHSSNSSSSSSNASSGKSASANASSSKNAGGGFRGSNSGKRSGSASGSSSGSDSDSDSSFSAKPTHAIMYTVNSSVASSSDAKQKAFNQHAKYLGENQAKGKVVFFGPWRDLPGSMAVVVAQSDSEATEIAKNDPAVRSGALTFEVRAWLVMTGVSSQSRK